MIPHNRPTIGDEEREAADRVLASGWLAQGREVQAFEDEVCAYLHLPPGHAVAVSSGSAALLLALKSLSAAGKRIGVPVYACAALPNAVHLAQAHSTHIDVSSGPNIDPMSAVGRADILIAAHMFGQPIRTDGFDGLVVEDCAHALGARVDGQMVGLKGDVGIFSFYATKLMTSGGQGGMLVSRARAVVDAARDYREFDQRHDHAPRFNLQMTDLQAAVGRAQLLKLPSFLQRRAEIYARYKDADLPLLDSSGQGIDPVRYRAVIKCRSPKDVIAALETSGIKAIIPVEEWELLAEPADYPHASALARASVSIPIYPSLENAAVARVIETLQRLGPLN